MVKHIQIYIWIKKINARECSYPKYVHLVVQLHCGMAPSLRRWRSDHGRKYPKRFQRLGWCRISIHSRRTRWTYRMLSVRFTKTEILTPAYPLPVNFTNPVRPSSSRCIARRHSVAESPLLYMATCDMRCHWELVVTNIGDNWFCCFQI